MRFTSVNRNTGTAYKTIGRFIESFVDIYKRAWLAICSKVCPLLLLRVTMNENCLFNITMHGTSYELILFLCGQLVIFNGLGGPFYDRISVLTKIVWFPISPTVAVLFGLQASDLSIHAILSLIWVLFDRFQVFLYVFQSGMNALDAAVGELRDRILYKQHTNIEFQASNFICARI